MTPEQKRRIEDQAQGVAQKIGGAADEVGCGFALLMFERHSGGWLTYVSNCEREDMITALRECADTLEQHRDVPPVRDQN